MSSELAHQPCQNSATYTEYGLHVFERTYLSAGFLLNFCTEGTTTNQKWQVTLLLFLSLGSRCRALVGVQGAKLPGATGFSVIQSVF